MPASRRPKKKEELFHVITYNVKTLSTSHRLLELMNSLKNTKYDVIGISEVRRLGTSIQEYDSFIFCYTGETRGLYGVGFIVKKYLKGNIVSFSGISERIALLRLNMNGYQLDILQVYAPTVTSTDDEVDFFYNTVSETLKNCAKNVIVMGDFNAKIGQPRADERLIMKNYGYGVRNSRGERLIDFANENKMSIMNTFFKKANNQRWTWKSPDGVTKNEIDYILTNQDKNVKNVQVLNINFPSDHRPLKASLQLRNIKKCRIKYRSNLKSSLRTTSEKETYRLFLGKLIDQLQFQDDANVQVNYDKITQSIERSLHNAKQHTTNPGVLSAYTKSLIVQRKHLHESKHKTRAQKNQLKALYKLISKSIKRDYTLHRSKTFEKHINTTCSVKRAYKELSTHKTWIKELKETNELFCNRPDIIKIATNFYKKLYDCQEKDNMEKLDNVNLQYIIKDVSERETIDELEVSKAIKSLKAEKCPGPDGITNESIKEGCHYLARPLACLFNSILESSTTPFQWSESYMILLYKKGDSKDIGNYRPISLLPSLYKLFSTIIEKRISKSIEVHQPIEQAGFRSGYSTIDHIHSIEQIIEKYNEYQRPLYVAFIDYQKAFDTILHSSIWTALSSQHVEQKYIEVIKYIYNNCSSRVKLESIGPPISIKRGVRQGDPLSPRIFIAVLEMAISQVNWNRTGLNINGKFISHLRFADDIILLSEDARELESMILSLKDVSVKVGLQMNLNKTKIMTNSIKYPLYLDQNLLEYVESYVYLGKQVSFDNQNNELEVERRISGAWRKFWSLKEILKGTMPINLKKKVMDTCLLPSITYGCQTWKYTLRVKNMIRSCQRGMERSITNVRKIQKIPHSIIRKNTKIIDALQFSLRLKWRWAGHVARMEDDRWTTRLTSWQGPAGIRKRGRPTTRWENDLIKIAGKHWKTKAKDRDKWKNLEEAFTLTRRGSCMSQ